MILPLLPITTTPRSRRHYGILHTGPLGSVIYLVTSRTKSVLPLSIVVPVVLQVVVRMVGTMPILLRVRIAAAIVIIVGSWDNTGIPFYWVTMTIVVGVDTPIYSHPCTNPWKHFYYYCYYRYHRYLPPPPTITATTATQSHHHYHHCNMSFPWNCDNARSFVCWNICKMAWAP